MNNFRAPVVNDERTIICSNFCLRFKIASVIYNINSKMETFQAIKQLQKICKIINNITGTKISMPEILKTVINNIYSA